MADTFTWDCTKVQTYPTYTDASGSAYTDVIHAVLWTLTKDNGIETRELNGHIGVSLDDLSTFTDFSSITAEEVVSWTHARLGADRVAYYENNIDAILDGTLLPESVVKTIGE